MSEYDTGGHDDSGSYGADVNAENENYELDHGQEAYGDQNAHLHDESAYGDNHESELNEHYAHGDEVESDTPYSHFDQSSYTEADVHAEQSDSSFGEHVLDADQSSSFGEADFVHESAQIQELQEHFFSGGEHEALGGGAEQLLEEGGQDGEVSAVSS